MQDNQMKPQQSEQADFQLIDVWYLFWTNKYWFLLSVFVCLTLAIIYIASVPNTFMRSASIMIKDAQRNGITEMAVFQDMKGYNAMSNVNNEAASIKSPSMVAEVVKRLKLDVGYFGKRRLYQDDLYGRSPIVASFPDASVKEAFSFEALLSKGQVVLSKFKVSNEEVPHSDVTVLFGDTVATPVGRVVIHPTLHYDSYFKKRINVRKYNNLSIAKLYSNKLEAKVAGDMTTIINISLTDVSERRAENILDTLIAVYNQSWIDDKNLAANNSVKFIEDRLNVIAIELNKVDSEKEEYKSANRVTSVQAIGVSVLGRLDQYNQSQLELENELEVLQYLKNFLLDQNKKDELLPSSTIGKLNLSEHVSEYNNLLLNRNRLRDASSKHNPMVVDLNSRLASIRQSIVESVGNVIKTTQIQLALLQKQEKKTDKLLAENPEQERHLLSFEREQSVKQQHYVYLLQKKEENELTKTISVNNAKIISPAQGAGLPIAPKRSVILLVAFFIGLAIPGAIFWLIEILDTTIKTKKDLGKLLVPFVGEIPYSLKNKKKKSNNESQINPADSLVVQERSRDVVSEAFRIIRSNMDFMSIENKKSHLVVLTSFNAGSGKTFITQNLSMSFALTGKKVIAVDLDLRKATLSKIVPFAADGVTSYLCGKIMDLDKLIVKAPFHDNFDVLPAGIIPPNPSELLMSDRLLDLLEALKQKYDYIFMDTTPAGIVADAVIVGKLADITLFIVREGLLDKRLLPEIDKLHETKKFNNMGVLLNCSSYSSSYYGYSRYGYGYGNGYYQEN